MTYENKVKNESLIIYIKLSIFRNIYIVKVLDSKTFFFFNFFWKIQKPFSLIWYTSNKRQKDVVVLIYMNLLHLKKKLGGH